MADFLDKIMGNVDKYITAAGIVAGEFAEAAKIKADMYSIKRKRDQALMEIGEAVYRMYLKGSFDMNKITEKCKYVANLNGEIREIENEAKNARKSSKKHGSKKHRKHYKEPQQEQQDMELQNSPAEGDNSNQIDTNRQL